MRKSKKLDSITREGEKEGGGCINISNDNTFFYFQIGLYLLLNILYMKLGLVQSERGVAYTKKRLYNQIKRVIKT